MIPEAPPVIPFDETAFTCTLRDAAQHLQVPLSPETLTQYAVYTRLLLETNRHTNLTRIVAPADVAVKHFADSLTLLSTLPDLKLGAALADVGTGAGFPGLVVKIARPDLHLTLIDSLAKRLTFLQSVVDALNLDHVTLIHARAEDAGRDPALRDQFTVVTARAVAALPTLLEWCGPLVQVGGRFVALKAAGAVAERDAAREAARQLKLSLTGETIFSLPDPALEGSDADMALYRHLLVYRKNAPTPVRFPRPTAQIKNAPL